MAAILVLATFAIFILIDWLLSRHRIPQTETVRAAAASPQAQPVIGGFLVPEELRYHPGHTWTLQERRNQERIGADEFAAALAGQIDKIELPQKGHWIRQGQKVATVYRQGQKAELVSPTEGEVIEVNENLLKSPALLREDPYGKGWLATVHVPDEEDVTRNLVPRSLVRSWMREAVDHLYALQPRLAGSSAADGGRPVRDLLAGIPGANWQAVAGEFFLTH
jgi:glycine cleavage system H protein